MILYDPVIRARIISDSIHPRLILPPQVVVEVFNKQGKIIMSTAEAVESNTRILTRLAIARTRRKIEEGFADEPEMAAAALAHLDEGIGKIDPNNLMAILKFLGELLAMLLPLFIKK